MQNTSITHLYDGNYIMSANGCSQNVFVYVAHDTIRVHCNTHSRLIAELSPTVQQPSLCDIGYPFYYSELSLLQRSFDVDFLTIPLKLRMPQYGLPAQFNANVTGAIYFGHRTDRHILRYEMNFLRKLERKAVHLAYSVGVFTGFGNSLISPTTTRNVLQVEYDGLVWSKGMAGIFGLNNFTVGLAIGFDNLLESNRKYWIYENKVWYGFVFGVNLN